jgi:hypothetical protein
MYLMSESSARYPEIGTNLARHTAANPEFNAGELYVADATVKDQIAYSLPIAVAKSLQKRVSSGQMQLGAMYKEIEKSLVQKSLPKP